MKNILLILALVLGTTVIVSGQTSQDRIGYVEYSNTQYETMPYPGLKAGSGGVNNTILILQSVIFTSSEAIDTFLLGWGEDNMDALYDDLGFTFLEFYDNEGTLRKTYTKELVLERLEELNN